MNILHTESSKGWGGQEIRILKEAIGMRERGHEIILAVARGGGLVSKAKEAGFTVYELSFSKFKALFTLVKLFSIFKKHKIHLVNTHSSLDAWIGGLAGRLARKKIIRTRHLSTPIRAGLNSRLLYNFLADFVVTTSSGILPKIIAQAHLSPSECKLVATGVERDLLNVTKEESASFREKWGIKSTDFLVGTVCFVRSWKGIQDLMHAAKLLEAYPTIKWAVIGGGFAERYYGLSKELGLEGRLFFTGHLPIPYAAMGALDVFALLSTAHEGISQACLQAAYLQKPLLTTTVGGLSEVCLHEKTGLLVPPSSPKEVAKAVLTLFQADDSLRKQMGAAAKLLVENKFTMEHTLNQMEEVYAFLKA